MPKNKLIVKEVDFFGDMLKTARDELGIVWAGVTWLCDGIGLSDGQKQKENSRLLGINISAKFICPIKIISFIYFWLPICASTTSCQQHTLVVKTNIIYHRKMVIRYCLFKSPKEIIC